MINLLLFAYLIRCLLEYRVDQREAWLEKFALVCGIAVANSSGIVALLPCFLIAVIWIKGMSFFNVRFIIISIGCWLVGFSLILLLPLVGSLSHTRHLAFWDGLHSIAAWYKWYLTRVPRPVILLLCLTSVLPILVLSIRWPSSFGDTSPLGIFLANCMFHAVHAVLLLACAWTVLDSPLSPRQKGLGQYFGFSYLQLYYLTALCIGYFSAYFLLVCSSRPTRNRRPPAPLLQFISRSVVLCVWLLAFGLPTLLVARNLPRLRANRHDALAGYLETLEKSLPAKGAVLLCDDTSRAFYVQALLQSKGRQKDFLVLHSHSMIQPAYVKFLERLHPEFGLNTLLTTNQMAQLESPVVQVQLLEALAKKHEVYYLHPSFGYYFESFYLEPHGLTYRMLPYPAAAPGVPAPSKEVIAENEAVWQAVSSAQFPRILRDLRSPETARPAWVQWAMDKLRLKEDTDFTSQRAAGYFSLDLNYWGVELQICGDYRRAGECFTQSVDLNPDNASARINQDFNVDLQAGRKPRPLTDKEMQEKFRQHRTWDDLMGEDGPVDEPSFCYRLGMNYAQTRAYRQAIEQFRRVHALAPADQSYSAWLAQLYVLDQNFSNSLAAADLVLGYHPDDLNGLLIKGVSYMQMKDHARAIPVLTRLITLQTNHYTALLDRAICNLESGNLDAARVDYTTVAKSAPQVHQAYYGLAEIAFRQKDRSNAIYNYQLYLTNAPANTEEAKMVATRLKELQAGKD